MRICLICNRRDEDDVMPTCAACGEASWMQIDAEPVPDTDPSPEPEPERKVPRRGRK